MTIAELISLFNQHFDAEDQECVSVLIPHEYSQILADIEGLRFDSRTASLALTTGDATPWPEVNDG